MSRRDHGFLQSISLTPTVISQSIDVYSRSLIPFYSEFLTKKHPQVGFEPPLIDDTSYEADAPPTKPPWPDEFMILFKNLIEIFLKFCS